MTRLLDFLFKGGTGIIGLKPGAWMMAGLLIVSFIENGGNDGKLEVESSLVSIVFSILTIFSGIWSWTREK
jgi:hypothetical protein